MSSLNENHYIGLAEAFLKGRTHITDLNKYSINNDIAQYKNKYFVYFGPTPAILLIPSVIFLGTNISQHSLGILFSIIDFILVYRIARIYKFNKNDSLWLGIFFIFGTGFILLNTVNITSYQVQTIATSFLIIALHEFLYKRRWLLIGICIALAATTRLTLYLSSSFFFLEILLAKYARVTKIHNLLKLSIPLIISLIILGYYNFIRFGSFIETGYSYQTNRWADQEALSHGLFSIEHIPGNLYFLLFKGPEPVRLNNLNYVLKFPYLKANYWGMSIFFIAPLLIYIFSIKVRAKHNIPASIAVSIFLIAILSYYGIGLWQYGYRYTFDFYPLLFLLLISVFNKGLPARAKILIVYSLIFNFYLMLSVWNVYW